MAHVWKSVEPYVNTAVKVGSALHTGYQVGKALWGLTNYLAPAAALLL
jgi:hypothetical protein